MAALAARLVLEPVTEAPVARAVPLQTRPEHRQVATAGLAARRSRAMAVPAVRVARQPDQAALRVQRVAMVVLAAR